MSKPKRKAYSKKVAEEVLHEAGYRCAVPTCRTILLHDLHHIIEVAEGGGNEPANLLVLCPNCHALYHRGKIPRESILKWKTALVELNKGSLGLTIQEAERIAKDLFQANILKLANVAADAASKRAFELTGKFFDQLQRKAPGAISAMADPDMQYSLFAAQRDYARIGDKDLGDVLVDLLVERASQPDRNVMQIALNESLAVAPKLTVQQLDTLSLIFLLRHTMLKTVADRESAAKYIDDYYVPFTSQLTTEMSCYLHIEYCGCSHLGPGFFDIPHNWICKNNHLFQKGFEMSELQEIAGGDSRFGSLVKPCINNPSLFQFCVSGAEEIKKLCEQVGINIQADKLQLLINMHGRSTMTWPEAREWLIAANPRISNLFAVWDERVKCFIKCYTLTNVGKIIGHANFRRRTNHELDQEWDRTLSEPLHWSISPYPH